MKKPARELPKFILRFSEELRDQIKAAADKNNRSMSAEIVSLIEEGFEQREYYEELEASHREHMDDPSVQAAFEQHERDIAEEERLLALGRRASAMIDQGGPRTSMIVPPDGMSRDEMSALLERALRDSHRRAMDMFQSMVIEKGGSVVPIEDDKDNP